MFKFFSFRGQAIFLDRPRARGYLSCTMKNKFLTLVALSFLFTGAARADEMPESGGTSVAVDDGAPAPKKWKASASTYFYSFQGTRPAQDDLYSFGDTTLNMQLASVQYQATPKLTLLALANYQEHYVETNMFGMTFRDKTKGLGDTLVDAIYMLHASPDFLLLGDAGVFLPTGAIDRKNASNPALNYAYNMQPGSGTFDPQVGLTAIGLHEQFQAGLHGSATIRTGRNDNGYRLGNLYKADGWIDVPVGLGLIPRLTGYYKVKQAIDGQDKTLGRTVLTEYYHHDQANWDVSAALKFERAIVRNVTLVAEAGKPIYQDSRNSDQVMVSTNYYGTLGLSGAF